MKATTRIVLPHFAEHGKPFALLFWSRDPDASQHGTRDSLGEMMPGINGPSGMAGTRDADTMLGELLALSEGAGLDKTTDVFVTADHGFTTISHSSATSPSAHFNPSAPLVDLPSGFLAIDLAASLGLPLRAPGDTVRRWISATAPQLPGGSGMLGSDPAPSRHGGGGQWRLGPDLSAGDECQGPRPGERDDRGHRQISQHPGLCQRDFRE